MTTLSVTTFWRERPYLSVLLNHFCVDVLNSSRNLLVAILAINLGMNNAQLATNLLLYNIGGSLTQPFFGWLADRIGPRWLVIGGMGWMMAFYALAAILADWPALVAATVAGLGSGAFHPTGTMVASQISQTQQGRATAIFFMSGQLGLFSGPVMAGFLLEGYGRPGYLVLPVLGFIAFISAWQWLLTPTIQASSTTRVTQTATTPTTHPPRRTYFLLPFIIMSYSSVGIAAMTFAPKLFIELNYSTDYVGWLSGLFMMGSAIGGIIGGSLADRYPGKQVIIWSLLISIAPLYYYIPLPGFSRLILLLLAGLFSGMPHSILILAMQSLLPGRHALASGLALGGMFFSGAIGSLIIGAIADEIGLAVTLQGTAVLPLIAVLASLFLPQK